MVDLVQFWQRVTGQTSEAFCLTCKTSRRVKKVRYVTQQTSKSRTRRLEGQCTICAGKTSRYVAHVATL